MTSQAQPRVEESLFKIKRRESYGLREAVNGFRESVRLGRLERTMVNWKGVRRYFLTGLLVLVPAWGTFLILNALFHTIDGLIADLLGPAARFDVPGLGMLSLLSLILLAGMLATQFLGQRLLRWTDERLQQIPLVSGIYLTLKGMTDLWNFRARFNRSTVVVFPFPRRGLWALGFVMGAAPPSIQVVPLKHLLMVFVPTAIHPFTGYLAFVPQSQVFPVDLQPEEAMKMEFSAGLYRPQQPWLTSLTPSKPAQREGS
ncbi:MAG: DUF502 domain-containing protein [Nitrospira sp.]|nr:DUF502 domain-containing protein [Nitrospira sp.]